MVDDETTTTAGATLGFDTLALHAGTPPDPTSGSRAQPIHATAAYVFESAEQAAALFAGDIEGNQYGRMHNPTVAAFAERMRQLEGGAAAVAFASGQAASAATLLALTRPGARVLLTREAFGGTHSLFRKWLEPWGVTVTPVAPTAESISDAMGSDVAAVWVESIANPSCTVPDLPALAEASHRGGAPLIVDNTWGCGGYLVQPIAHGADAVVHSATKWIGGHGTFIGGVMIDAGRFRYQPDRHPGMHAPDGRGRSWIDRAGATALAARAFDLGLFTWGASLSPHSAFYALQGLETLSLRCARSCASALKLARHLEDAGYAVRYPGLASHASHAIACRLLRGGFGAVVTLDLADQASAFRVLNRFSLLSMLANIGDAKSVAIHPWTTTHASMSEAARRAAGVQPGSVRISVGLETPEDIVADVMQALAAEGR
jgi:O-acetylhomoserine/O-acetylserine sulfhydrylase-like pyridoxal-dependent enzyme